MGRNNSRLPNRPPIHSRSSAGLVRNPGRAATESEEQNKNKFKVLADDGYLFQPLVFCVQVAASIGKIVEQAS